MHPLKSIFTLWIVLLGLYFLFTSKESITYTPPPESPDTFEYDESTMNPEAKM